MLLSSISTCIRKRTLLCLNHFITTSTITTSTRRGRRTNVSLHSINLSKTESCSSSSDSDDDPSLPPPSQSQPPSTSHTVSFFVETCGLSPTSATAIAPKVRITNPLKTYSVIKFLKDHCFTTTQIASLIAKRPCLISISPTTSLIPKVEFFARMGLAGPDFARVVTSNPSILSASLETKIMGSIACLKAVLGTDDNVVCALKRNPWLLHVNIDQNLITNFQTLRSHNVPSVKIVQLLVVRPSCLMHHPDVLAKIISDLKDLGYDDPGAPMFVYAFKVMSGMSREAWNEKVEAYRSLGWLDDEIVLAFKRHPYVLLKSVQGIRKVVGFLMGELHVKPEHIIRKPQLISLSLDKTIIPRYRVFNLLKSKGVVTEGSKLLSMLRLSKAKFVDACIAPYRQELPEVLEAWEGSCNSKVFNCENKIFIPAFKSSSIKCL